MRQENMRKEAAVRSIAGSTVLKDSCSSLKIAPLPLNRLKMSPWEGGHTFMPSRNPVAAKELGVLQFGSSCSPARFLPSDSGSVAPVFAEA